MKTKFTLKILLSFWIISILIPAAHAKHQDSYVQIDSLDILLASSQELRRTNSMYDALKLAYKANTYAQQLNNNYYIAYSYYVMAAVKFDILDYKSAKKQFQRALIYAEKTESYELITNILTELGDVYYDDQKDLLTSLNYYKRATEISINKLPPEKRLYPISNVVWTYMDLNKYEKTPSYLALLENNLKQVDPDCYCVKHIIFLLRARNQTQLGNLEKATENFDKMYAELTTHRPDWQKGKSYFYEYRSLMYETFGLYPQALADQKKYRESEDIVFRDAAIHRTVVEKIRFEVDRYEDQLKASKMENILLKNISNNDKKISYLSILSSILLALIVFFLYRGNRIKKKSNLILASKNKELQIAKKKEVALNKSKSRFISRVSHELRTPLYGIIGISTMLSEGKSYSKKDQKLLESLKFSGEYLLNLVNKVLTISKMDSKKVTLKPVPNNLHTTANNIINSFKFQAEDKGLYLKLDYDKSIPKQLMIDTTSISEVLINLIGNAMKFTTKGGIILRISQIKKTAKYSTLHFDIEDTGIGIEEDQKDEIFQEFTQVDSLYDSKKGTGLGLSIVKNLLLLMGGKIMCKSKKNVGSTFYFKLRLPIVTNNVNLSKSKKTPNETLKEISSSILLVEDNKINQLVTQNLLKNIGCPCRIAQNGKEAIEMMKNNAFDLVLMDLNMPVMNGMEATEKIRKFDHDTPIIALTASELSEVSDDCFQIGINDLINKPLNQQNLKEIILNNLEFSKNEP